MNRLHFCRGNLGSPWDVHFLGYFSSVVYRVSICTITHKLQRAAQFPERSSESLATFRHIFLLLSREYCHLKKKKKHRSTCSLYILLLIDDLPPVIRQGLRHYSYSTSIYFNKFNQTNSPWPKLQNSNQMFYFSFYFLLLIADCTFKQH